MINNLDKRCVELAKYIIDTNATVRQTATVFGMSKSTVHIDVTKRLYDVSPELAVQVNKILQENKAQRHIRGGIATKEKYFKLKNNWYLIYKVIR